MANYRYKERLSLFFIYNCHLGKEYERSADLSHSIDLARIRHIADEN